MIRGLAVLLTVLSFACSRRFTVTTTFGSPSCQSRTQLEILSVEAAGQPDVYQGCTSSLFGTSVRREASDVFPFIPPTFIVFSQPSRVLAKMDGACIARSDGSSDRWSYNGTRVLSEEFNGTYCRSDKRVLVESWVIGSNSNGFTAPQYPLVVAQITTVPSGAASYSGLLLIPYLLILLAM